MLVRGATHEQLRDTLALINAEHGASLRFGQSSWNHDSGLRPSGRGWRFVLRTDVGVFSRRRPYLRCRHLRHAPFGATTCAHGCRPPRMASVCWHGHQAFMRALFALAPDARFVTGVITYKGAADFEREHDETGWRNIGMQCAPIAHREACDCEERDESPTDTYGADEAHGAANRAMAAALAMGAEISRQRAGRV